MVIQSWGERLTGDPIFVLMKKLQRLKIAIKIWRKDNMGGLQMQIETSVVDLEDLQAQLDTNYSDRLMKEASSKQASLNGLLNLEDSIWRQKTKASWLVSGERNTRYFHALQQIKTQKSQITEVALENGSILSNQNNIKEHIVDYYKAKFTHVHSNINADLVGLTPTLITEEKNKMLSILPSPEEARMAVFDLNPWETFLRAKFFTRGGLLINYNKHSSIWNGLKEAIAVVQANSKWIIGLGRDINFWRDCWGSEVALIDLLNIQPKIWKHCTSKLILTGLKSGGTVAQKASSFSQELLPSSGKSATTRCQPRITSLKGIWDWLASLFHIQAAFTNLKKTLDACSQKSAYILDLWKAVVLNFIYFLWRARNDIVFEGTPFCSIKLKCKILAAVKEVADLSANSMSNNYFDLVIVVALGVSIKARPLPRVQSCTWALPWFQEVKINVGEVAMGSPRTAGTRAVARNHCGEVI
ncbi:hypothetical protein GIB67_023188, partial [Kingdonia uniflora]